MTGATTSATRQRRGGEASGTLPSGETRPKSVHALRVLPKGRDELPLLDIASPQYALPDLVLGARTRKILLEVVREVRHDSVLRAHGVRPRNRLLFVGPPGCGKSATAAALAAELGWPIARVDLATVVSSLLGETARNIAAIFEFCRYGSLVLLFDELDSIAKERADRTEHGELKRVVATFLQLLDAFTGHAVVIAATNHPSLLDRAVWRRFDEIAFFDVPKSTEVRSLIDIKLRAVEHATVPATFVRRMRGFTQAEIELVCHSALRRALLDDRRTVELEDMAQALAGMEERKRAIRVYST